LQFDIKNRASDTMPATLVAHSKMIINNKCGRKEEANQTLNGLSNDVVRRNSYVNIAILKLRTYRCHVDATIPTSEA